MAFSGNFMCTSFKVELLQGKHDFTNGQDTFKLALFTNSAEPTQGSFGGSGSTMNGSVTDPFIVVPEPPKLPCVGSALFV